MRELLRETALGKKAMEERVKKLTRAFSELQDDLLWTIPMSCSLVQIACSKLVLLKDDAREQNTRKLMEFTKIGDKDMKRNEVIVTYCFKCPCWELEIYNSISNNKWLKDVINARLCTLIVWLCELWEMIVQENEKYFSTLSCGFTSTLCETDQSFNM